jgi:YfiH family protein
VIRSALLAALPGLSHAHSTRADGSISPAPGEPDAFAEAARAEFVRAAGGDPEALVHCVQVHGNRVAVADRAGVCVPATDGLVTAVGGIPLLVKGADCPLVALYDPDARVAAVVHTGWRGTVARIADEAVGAMCLLGANPGTVSAAVFPGIGPCCFEVGTDVADAFASSFGDGASAWFRPGADASKRTLDLAAAITATLVGAAVARERIDVVPGCTKCGGVLFSHRGSGGGPGRHGLCVVLV